MIGKLVIFGIIAVAVIVIAPNLLKGNSHDLPIATIRQDIDKARHIQPDITSSVGYGGVLANSSATSTGASPASQGSPGLIQAAGTSALPPQDTVRQTYTGQVFSNTNGTCQVSVPGMVETVNGQQEVAHIIQVPNCNLQVNKPVQVVSTTPKQNSTESPDHGRAIQVIPYSNDGSPGSASSTSSTSSATSASQPSNPSAPAYFQTVQLSAVNQGTGAILSYDDTTGQTVEVTVTMKNSARTIFSGTFYSSQFHTEVNDVPNTPHIIEMTIQNAIYGTLHASIYAPSNIQNSTISGIFAN